MKKWTDKIDGSILVLGIVSILVIVAMVLIAVVTAVNKDDLPTEYRNESLYTVNNFKVFIDNRAGVACWYQDGVAHEVYAISCLPIDETRLENNETHTP